ncbi:hypothetical protein L2E82_46003 [Cichorium intybus]|uniref:Uncharacterized protein n=1 Tax=Cichorium intybus TaxID=13427 RepID=A0ACB8ZVH8_CICIN|nr:hypothetical protein L2E82_46003 [Cichorium intybus]
MNKLRALVVDDEKSQRRSAERLLEKSSFDVIATVESGETALKFLGLTEDNDVMVDVDLILTDHDMKGISGYELLLKLKNSELNNVPVVIMSASDDEERIKKCMDGGALMYLVKPLTIAKVTNLHEAIVAAGPSHGKWCTLLQANGVMLLD